MGNNDLVQESENGRRFRIGRAVSDAVGKHAKRDHEFLCYRAVLWAELSDDGNFTVSHENWDEQSPCTVISTKVWMNGFSMKDDGTCIALGRYVERWTSEALEGGAGNRRIRFEITYS